MNPRPGEGEREAARLRYELSRLRAKRSVRLALLAGRAASPRALLATLRRTRVQPDLDVIAPARVVRRPAYPHLRVAYVGAQAPFASAAPHVPLESPGQLKDVGADLLVVDGTAGWATAELNHLSALAGKLNVPRLLWCRAPDQFAIAPLLRAELIAASGAVLAGATERPAGPIVELEPWVDAAAHNPVGWDRASLRAGPAADVATAGSSVDAVRLAELRALATRCPPGSENAYAVDDETVDIDERERWAVRGSREVLAAHESLVRFEQVLEALEIPRRPPPRISVLLCTRRPGLVEQAVAQIDRQDHPDVEVVLVLHGEGFDPDDVDKVRNTCSRPLTVIPAGDGTRFGDALNLGLDAATGSLVAKMDDDDVYGTRHLSDLVLALHYSGADLVGKWANEVYLEQEDRTVTQDLDRQERWAFHIPGATMLIQGDMLRRLRFRRVDRAVDTHLLRSLHEAGGSAYSTHRFGFIRVRRASGHTSARSAPVVAADSTRRGLDRSGLEI